MANFTRYSGVVVVTVDRHVNWRPLVRLWVYYYLSFFIVNRLIKLQTLLTFSTSLCQENNCVQAVNKTHIKALKVYSVIILI